MEQEIYLLQSDFGQWEDARTYEIGVFSTYEKAYEVKEEFEAKIYASQQIKITNKTSNKKREEWYKAGEFNFCTITKFTLDKWN